MIYIQYLQQPIYIIDDTMINLNNSSAILNVEKGEIRLTNNKVLTNAGRINMGSGGVLTLLQGAKLENKGTILLGTGSKFANQGNIVNSGTLTINSTTASNTGTIDNTGTINGTTIEESKYFIVNCSENYIYNGEAPKCTVKDRKTGTDYTKDVTIKYSKALRMETGEVAAVVYSPLFDTAPTDALTYIPMDDTMVKATNPYYMTIDFTDLLTDLELTTFLTNASVDSLNPGYYKYVFRIEPKEVTIKYDRYQKLTGSNITITPILEGIITGDTVTYTTSGTITAKDKGFYNFTITGLTGVDATNYILKTTSYDWWIEEEKTVTNTDDTTKIVVEANTEVIPPNTELVIEKITEGPSFVLVNEAMREDASKFMAFDIKLLNNDEEIKPNGKMKIKIPIPEGYDKKYLYIYYIDDNGNKTEMPSKIIGNYIVFETDHFSSYVMAELPSNPRTNDNILTYTLIGLCSLVGIALMLKKIKKHN